MSCFNSLTLFGIKPVCCNFSAAKPVKFLHSESLNTFEPHCEKLDFCLCVNKGAYQLCSNCEADQRLCFRTISLLLKSEISSF